MIGKEEGEWRLGETESKGNEGGLSELKEDEAIFLQVLNEVGLSQKSIYLKTCLLSILANPIASANIYG